MINNNSSFEGPRSILINSIMIHKYKTNLSSYIEIKAPQFRVRSLTR